MRPNIVFIMADDMGIGDVGCYNAESKIPTPNMDRMAAGGMMFTDAHSASAVCTPSRYGVLTGRYCWRSRLKNNVLYGYEPPLIEPERLTVASMLREEGYTTACIGKWHLGLGYAAKEGMSFEFQRELPWENATREDEQKIDFAAGVAGGPTELGFDYFFGTSGCSTCQPPYGFIDNDRFVDLPSEYVSDFPFTGRPGMTSPSWRHQDADPVFTEKAVEWIKARQSDDAPFFLYLAASAPHEPCVDEVVPEFARGKSEAGPRGDLVWLYDWMVGRIMDVLDETGQTDNTLLVVTSDNGALPGDRVRGKTGMEAYSTYGHKSSGDWRGYKAHIWEGGHREPLIVRWPGQVPAGESCGHLVGLNDFMATCADLVDRPIREDEAEDSTSLLPLLRDPGRGTGVRESLIHHSHLGVFSIRRGAWKLIVDCDNSGGWPPPRGSGPVKGTPGQLYNLDTDPAERENLWESRPQVVAELSKLLDNTRQ